jgi:hypothetical protein
MVVKSQKDLVSGLMFTIVGGSFALGAQNYSVGTAARMGPGYFPLLLGVILAILGIVVTLQAFGAERNEEEQIGKIAWKPLGFIIGANLLFGILLGGMPSIGIPAFGLMIAIVALTYVSALAGETFSFKEVTVLALILAVGSYLVFVKMLGLAFLLWPAFITG